MKNINMNGIKVWETPVLTVREVNADTGMELSSVNDDGLFFALYKNKGLPLLIDLI